jgi:hypothetical protein
MGDIFQDVYSAATNCITTSFCLDGGSYDSSDVQMPRSLKIRVVANPDFWGFGSLSGNTLIEGWGSFNEGKFDFFDGHEPDHTSLKTCPPPPISHGPFSTHGPYKNEQRPDVGYRSVYDPENGNANYNFATNDGIVRGGAENYLLDRASEQGSDDASCDTVEPVNVFKTNPAGYGLNPKILFNSAIYKNNTGAWRIEECTGCYDTDIINPMRVYDCSGSPKQHINADGNFANLYDPFQSRCLASGFTSESRCGPDGTVAENYAGVLTSIVRDTGVNPFLQLTFQYDGGAASALINGQALGIAGSQANDGVVNIFDVTHGASSTTAYAVGTFGTGNYTDSTAGTWIAFDTYDPATCCGGAAYGIENDTKKPTNVPLYHIDIGRVFNNPKNVLYSNRIDRTYNGYTTTTTVDSGVSLRDYSYVAVNESGHALLVASGAIHNIELACETGVWNAKATHIYKLGDTYSTESGVGSTAIPTDSGFVPLFPKELPYFGPFMETDRWDNNKRSPQGGNRETNKNSTCYTKQGSLSVYPDCLSQWTKYMDCDPVFKYTLNNVPRLSFLYRGCDYDDPCTFDDSGRPWTAGASGHPSNMQDLIRGFGGQEIQMFINLGTARAAEIKREPCCCDDPPCPGTAIPEFVEIESPVTFPCFPKFDLRPSQYGCQDPLHYFDIMRKLELSTDTTGSCTIPYYDACTPRQPYTTYGYIRNLCGKETNSRRGVIDSLSTKRHTGNYTDLAFSNNTVEPMYKDFIPDTPNCCAPSGFPVATEECIADLLGHYDHLSTVISGSGATAEMVISLNPGVGGCNTITYNVLTPGSGYLYGGGVLVLKDSLGDPIVDPVQRFNLTFGAPNDGLLSITSTKKDPLEPCPDQEAYKPRILVDLADIIVPLTIVGSSSGMAGNGGFSYITCDDSGTTHYWGLADYQGRLAIPYFNTKPNAAVVCEKDPESYVDFDSTGTLAGDWPKDHVPFLIEIDHEDNCTTCTTAQMPTGNLFLTIESLSAEYLHGLSSVSNHNDFSINGWTHNLFPGEAITPIYIPTGDVWEQDYCVSGDGRASQYGQANVGETCDCADGATTLMVPRVIEGTNVPIGYISSGSRSSNGEINSYFQFGECGLEGLFPVDATTGLGGNRMLNDHILYISVSMGCLDVFSTPWGSLNDPAMADTFGAGGLYPIYGCGGNCATSFPSPNGAPQLAVDFFFVNRASVGLFENMSDTAIRNNSNYLVDGIDFTPSTIGGFPTSPGTHAGPGTIVCGNDSGTFSTLTVSPGCGTVSSLPDSDYLDFVSCINGNKGKMQATVNIEGCIGSRIKIYGCSLFASGVYSMSAGGGGKFGNVGAGFVDHESAVRGGCTTVGGPWGTGEHFSNPCWEENPGLFHAGLSAAIAAQSGGSYGAIASLIHGCITLDSSRCCNNYASNQSLNPNVTPGGPFNVNGTEMVSNVGMGCACQSFPVGYDLMYDVTYSRLTNPVTGFVTEGWYGDVLYPISNPGTQLYWEGENLPGIGDIGVLPVETAIAVKIDTLGDACGDAANWTATFGQCQDADPGRSFGVSVENFSNYHTGPNRYSTFGAETFTPSRIDIDQPDLGPPNLTPAYCTNIPVSGGNSYYANCGTPAPFDTYSGGLGAGIRVVRRSTWPEVMTVHRIDCDASGYRLHVSREYFEHDRTWYTTVNAEPVPRLGLITGGESSLRYSCEETYLNCLDPGTGIPTPTVLDYSFARPLMTFSDSVTPVHPDLCATGLGAFFLTNESIIKIDEGYGTTDSTYSTGCLLFPSISGQQFYTYYNALYDSGSPGSEYLSQAAGGSYQYPPDPEADCNESYPHDLQELSDIGLPPVWTSADDIRSSHSCIQDATECGAMFWNNKEFFPRKSYLATTRITRFGALSICTQTSQLERPSWYGGIITNDIWDQSPNKEALSTSTFVDACDNDAVVLLSQDMGIDGNIIHIPHNNSTGGSPSILTLMGAIHPGFKADLNEKTCIYADSGECLDFLPEHNDRSIKDITFAEDEYGHYLDKLVASGSHECLFTPFKIMMDVECVPDRIGHRGTSDPTNLNYIATIPPTVCEGWVQDPVCGGCDSTSGAGGLANSCGWLRGQRLPGLSCMAGIPVNMVSTIQCRTECVTTTDETPFPPATREVWVVEPAPTQFLLGATPTLFSSGDKWQTTNVNCSGSECIVTSMDDSGIPTSTGYFYDEFATSGDFPDIYEYGGKRFTKGDPLFFDIFSYKGINYTPSGNAPNDPIRGRAGLHAQCCDPSGRIGIGAGDQTTQGYQGYGTTNEVDMGGCDCTWDICNNMFFGPIVIPDIGFFDFTTAVGVAKIDTNDGFNDELGCVGEGSWHGGDYPSVIKITITE